MVCQLDVYFITNCLLILYLLTIYEVRGNFFRPRTCRSLTGEELRLKLLTSDLVVQLDARPLTRTTNRRQKRADSVLSVNDPPEIETIDVFQYGTVVKNPDLDEMYNRFGFGEKAKTENAEKVNYKGINDQEGLLGENWAENSQLNSELKGKYDLETSAPTHKKNSYLFQKLINAASNRTGSDQKHRRRHRRSKHRRTRNREPWRCGLTTEFVRMDANIFPPYVQTGVCASRSCMYGSCECVPKTRKISGLKRDLNSCNPIPTTGHTTTYEEVWHLVQITVVSHCECSYR